MRKKTSPAVHKAAVALGSIKSRKKAVASRRNGKLGGRPSSGLCSERELRRRVRQFLSGKLSETSLSSFQSRACALRRKIISSGRPVTDYLSVSQGYERQLLALFPQTPLLL